MSEYINIKVFNFKGDNNEINRFKNQVLSTSNVFDFQKISPMPNELEISDNTRAYEVVGFVIDKISKEPLTPLGIKDNKTIGPDFTEEEIILGLAYIKNLIKYSYYNFSGWRRANWGTINNSKDGNITYDEFYNPIYTFKTKYSVPFPIFEKLSEMFPSISFDVEWNDKYNGNKGCITIKNKIIKVNY